MPNFRTNFLVPPASFSISHHDQVLLLGSCFTEHIGTKLAADKIPTLVNPFGIVYNPVSMARCLERLWAENAYFSKTDLFEHQGLWHSWEHHGHFSKPDAEATLDHLNAAYTKAAQALRQSNRLLLTMGTADVFLLRETEKVVANNHKMPAAHFDSRRLSVDEIVQHLVAVLQKIKTEQPDLQVILTVSPVRHLRAGAIENQRSKATLLLACAEISAQLPFTYYFPAYELLLDDLRDYRFYAADMIHPNEVAIHYIWQHFSQTFFSAETQDLLVQMDKINAALQHRPFHPESAQHQTFAQAQLRVVEALASKHPNLDFSIERDYFRRFR